MVILRSPFSLEKLRYHPRTGTVLSRSKMHPVLKRNCEVFSACDWLAALTTHIPNAGERLVWSDGWYSNASRGKHRKAQGEERAPIEEFSEIPASAATRAWARLIKQVSEVDPLVCPHCGGAMRILAFIEQPEVIALPVPGTCLRADTHRQAADRADPDASRPLARPRPQSACRGVPVVVHSATGRAV